jgi:hypothetical protein
LEAHNFLNSEAASRLQYNLTTIKPLTVEAIRGTMCCTALCKNFEANVSIVDLNNCDMMLGIQWLVMLGDIVSNYKELWMSFNWQGKKMLLKGNDLAHLQSIRFEQLNSLLGCPSQWAEVSLYSLRIIKRVGITVWSMSYHFKSSCGRKHCFGTSFRVLLRGV